MNKKVWVGAILSLIAIVVIDKFLLPIYTSSGREATVPNVKNISYGEAERILGKANLKAVKSYNVRYLPEVQPDIVIDQVPPAASTVKPGRNVYLVVNRTDKPSFAIPDLTGRPEEEARQILARLGMTVSGVQVRAVSKTEEDGRVLSQSVPPNVTVMTGSAISLIVGKIEQEPAGLKRVVVPDLLGMSIDQARSIIIQNGLVLGKITYERSALLVPNTVISQKPSVNSFAQSGQAVDMTVATNE
ncbi:MAG: PASTA domain-containing protein [Chlorobiaceae bacterium]|nr:PASTA domain-containing protein [Chlorobiaceae bacterium]